MEKKVYFSPGTIDEKSRNMLARINKLGLSHLDLKFIPQKAALLVLDVQEYFFSVDSHAYIPSAQAIIPNIQNLVEYFHLHNRPIFYSRHINDPVNAGMMAVWWRELLDINSEFSKLINDFDIEKGIVFQKGKYDAFWETPLNGFLKEAKVDQVVICGVMTHLCCETTARSAFIHDYQVFFTIDGTATYTEDLHTASLLTLAHGFAKTTLCKELVIDL